MESSLESVWKQSEAGKVTHGKGFTVSQVCPYTEEALRKTQRSGSPGWQRKGAFAVLWPGAGSGMAEAKQEEAFMTVSIQSQGQRPSLFRDLPFCKATLLEERY